MIFRACREKYRSGFFHLSAPKAGNAFSSTPAPNTRRRAPAPHAATSDKAAQQKRERASNDVAKSKISKSLLSVRARRVRYRVFQIFEDGIHVLFDCDGVVNVTDMPPQQFEGVPLARGERK